MQTSNCICREAKSTLQPFGAATQLLVLVARNVPFMLLCMNEPKSPLVAMSQTKSQSICQFEERLPVLPGDIHEFTKVFLRFRYKVDDYLLH